MIPVQADMPICSHVVLRSPENTTGVILAKTGNHSPEKDNSIFLDANK